MSDFISFLSDWSKFFIDILRDKYLKRKKISIESVEIFNSRKTKSKKDSSKEYFSNLIYNELKLKSVNKEVISSIVLKNISKTPNDYYDIQYDAGINNYNQKYLLLAYNNGNLEGVSNEVKITVKAIEDSTLKEQTVEKFTIAPQTLLPGEVRSTSIINLQSYVSIFKRNSKLKIIAIKAEILNRELPTVYASYNSDDEKFYTSLGAISKKEDYEVVLFDLRKCNDEEEVLCSKIITGISDLRFAIFVDENCILSYKIMLKSGKSKINNNSTYTLNIRIPFYKQENTTLYGDLYHFVLENNKDFEEFNYGYDIIKHLKKSIVFNKYEEFLQIKENN